MPMRKTAALLALVLLAGCSSTVAPTPSSAPPTTPTPTPEPVIGLAVGDCTGKIDFAQPASRVRPSTCENLHAYEVSAVIPVSGDEYPGQEALKSEAVAKCGTAFTEYVGVAATYSRYTSAYLAPDEETWKTPSDREIVCLVGQAGNWLGSAKGDTNLLPDKGECTGPNNVPLLELEVLPCAAAHNWEVFAVTTIKSKKLPSEKKVQEIVSEKCSAGFTKFVGLDVEKSKYEYSWRYISDAKLWPEVKDHRLVCMAGSDKTTTVGTLKGAKK
jgi:hypothetical protein